MSVYSPNFYAKDQAGARRSARVLVPILQKLIQPRSVIDVGCALGTWLSVFKERGVADIYGVDGPWVQQANLEIPPDKFEARDLTQPLRLPRIFDLAMSLEVAEHLPATSAATFVETLTSLAPVVFFSAAIPFQGGVNHINEQWPPYWIDLFAQRGYEVRDILRPRIWDNPAVDWFYAQNILLFAERGHPVLSQSNRVQPLALVHPRLFLQTNQFIQRLTQTAAEISRLVPVGQPFILVDDEQLRPLITAGSRSLPFLEKDGVYWGPPPDDATAIVAVERLRGSGATFIIFSWPALWWLTQYPDFINHLRTKFPCTADNEQLLAFDLRR